MILAFYCCQWSLLILSLYYCEHNTVSEGWSLSVLCVIRVILLLCWQESFFWNRCVCHWVSVIPCLVLCVKTSLHGSAAGHVKPWVSDLILQWIRLSAYPGCHGIRNAVFVVCLLRSISFFFCIYDLQLVIVDSYSHSWVYCFVLFYWKSLKSFWNC